MGNLQFDFNVDKTNNKVTVIREFDANLPLVWKAWTTPELLDQWWGPEPYKANTKSMDFREGGRWLYNMTGPEGDVHWSCADYKKIETEKMFSGLDAFCDEDGNLNLDFGRSQWENSFTESDGVTKVTVNIKFESLEKLEQHIEMGFKEGFTTGLDQLEALLANLQA